LKRDYVAEDPVYLTGQSVGCDTLQVADAPRVAHPCNELSDDFRRETQPAR
jgi:hypothetical protein